MQAASRANGRMPIAVTATVVTVLLLASLAIAAAPAVGKKPAQVYGWGWDLHGSLGDGKPNTSNKVRRAPVAVTALGGVTQIAYSDDPATGLALLDNGHVMGWGREDGNATEESTTPVAVEGLEEVTSVAAGEAKLALLGDGTVMAWGDDQNGAVGDGTTVWKHLAVTVGGLSGVVAISAYGEHSLAVLSNGTVWEWGRAYERDGLGRPIHDAPVQVPAIAGAVAVAAGGEAGYALLASGEVLAWGAYGRGELGDGESLEPGEEESLGPPPNPVYVCAVGAKGTELANRDCSGGPHLTGVTAIAAGRWFAVAAIEDGTAVAWGANESGQLGDGTNEGPEVCLPPGYYCSGLPVPVSGLSGVRAVAAGERHALAALEDGSVASWGGNEHGQLGAGSGAFGATAELVPGLSGIWGVGGGGAVSYAFHSPRPAVTKSKPAKGSAGNVVTIEGSSLLTATDVEFGATPATSFTVISPTRIEAIAPALAPGTYDVAVTDPSGTSLSAEKATFTVK